MIAPLVLVLAGISSVYAEVYEIQVGANGTLTYNPPYVNAVAQDVIRFIFNAKNHTVTQSTFEQPCTPSPYGFDSDFQPFNPNGTAPNPTKEITIQDGNPLWFFCKQPVGNHCGHGMVFAVNPGSGERFKLFQDAAMATLNATTSASSVAAAPTAQPWQTATATISEDSAVWTTTYTSYLGAAAPSPAPGGPVDHKILVGENGALTFNPPNITASVNDTVTFEFRAKNHTITQSTFGAPCTSNGGFNSGFKPVPQDSATFPTYTITINDTAPIWGYCAQTRHCQQGMVVSINAVADGPWNFTAFQNAAKATASSTNTTSSAPKDAALHRPAAGLMVGFFALAGMLL